MATKKGKSEGTTELAQSFKPAFTAGRLLLENSNNPPVNPKKMIGKKDLFNLSTIKFDFISITSKL